MDRSTIPTTWRLEKGNSNFDVRHRFVTSLIWQPRYFESSGKLVQTVLNGWSLAPVMIISSGRPYTESISGNDYTCSGSYCSTNYGMAGGINGSGGSYRLATLLPRNSFRYPAFSKSTCGWRAASGSRNARRSRSVEAFNLFNTEQVSSLNQTMYVVQSASSATPMQGVPAVLNYADNITGYSPFGSASAAGSNLTANARCSSPCAISAVWQRCCAPRDERHSEGATSCVASRGILCVSWILKKHKSLHSAPE